MLLPFFFTRDIVVKPEKISDNSFMRSTQSSFRLSHLASFSSNNYMKIK